MSNYLLVHGAWHGGWSWNPVSDALREQGHTVWAPDLPGHGSDPRPLSEMLMEAYVDRICRIVKTQDEPIILVGHSASGSVISRVADRYPESIQKLVYVCAFLLAPGESVLSIMESDPEGQLGPRLTFNEDQSGARMDVDTMREVFYNQTSESVTNWAWPQFIDLQPVAPLASPMELPLGGFSKVPRIYVKCTEDRVTSPKAQQKMIDANPCQQVFELDADHAPFLSRTKELVDVLVGL